METIRVVLDTEFTGLHKKTSLVSIGLKAESGQVFYGELTDYKQDQVDKWIQENVIDKLWFKDIPDRIMDDVYEPYTNIVFCKGDMRSMESAVGHFLCTIAGQNIHNDGKKIEIWGDVNHYDWVLFQELFGNAFQMPKPVYYIPFDLATLLKIQGIDPDINRKEYSGLIFSDDYNHNALFDAFCVEASIAQATDIPHHIYTKTFEQLADVISKVTTKLAVVKNLVTKV